MTFLIFVLVLSILIIVHEAGHFLMARKLGVRVEEFALGFGPKIFSWKSGGTDYRLCAIPLGGYVKMAGDERDKCQGMTDEFFSKSPGHRALIALMGPVVNYALAYFCFVVVFMVGYVDLDASMKALPAKIGKVMAGSPAEKAGVKVGDTVVKIGTHAVAGWSVMQDEVMGSGGKTLDMVVARGQEQVSLKVTPESQISKDIFGREHPVSRIGVQPDQSQEIDKAFVKRYGVRGAFKKAGQELWLVTAKTYSSLWEIVIGARSAKEGMTGLIGIFFIIKFAASVGFAFLLHIIGVISASLAIFNLLPLIPLDGGHLALLGLEKLRSRPLSPKAEDIITRVGFGLIIVLALFVFYVDFERIGLIDKVIHFFK
ncbi:MAG: site-2 protease family protein [Candidatus Omnitrophica bacterium]|nr:site-2 protease family protein [Candidatus Omnitrophota bacterium]